MKAKTSSAARSRQNRPIDSPTFFPEAKERTGPKITGAPNEISIWNAEEISRYGDRVDLRGQARLSFQGYDLQSDEVSGDLSVRSFLARGRAMLLYDEAYVRGRIVSLNASDRTFSAFDARAQLSPRLIQGRLTEDLYTEAEETSGSEERVFLHRCSVTTCNLEKPHFFLAANRMDVIPGRRARLTGVTVTVLDRRLIRIPSFTVPLAEFSDRYVPEIGQSREEGFFVKTRTTVPLRGASYIDTRLDYYSRLGFGFGNDVNYVFDAGRGIARWFSITGRRRSASADIRHQQRLAGGQLFLDGVFNQNSYLVGPDVTTLNFRASYGLASRTGTTNVDFFRTGTSSVQFRSFSEVLSVQDQRQLGRDFQAGFNLALNTNESRQPGGGAAIQRRLDLQSRGAYRWSKADATIEYQRSIPVSGLGEFFAGSDRTPVLSLRTDSSRIFGPLQRWNLPFTLELSAGEWADPLQKRLYTRYFLDLQMNRSSDPNRALSASWSGSFRQGLYNDDTAQYVLQSFLTTRFRQGKGLEIRLGHNYLRGYGYTPLSIDRTGIINVVNYDATFESGSKFSASLSTGYDLAALERRQAPWQPVQVRIQYRPNEDTVLRANTVFESSRSLWSIFRFEGATRILGGGVSFNAQYDGFRRRFGPTNLFLEGLTFGKLKISAILNYNGYRERFDSRQYALTYDLHCSEAILVVSENLVGFRAGTEVGFFIRIKGLPFETPFGIGRRGQAIGGGGVIRP